VTTWIDYLSGISRTFESPGSVVRLLLNNNTTFIFYAMDTYSTLNDAAKRAQNDKMRASSRREVDVELEPAQGGVCL
jgi:hypothetical protein